MFEYSVNSFTHALYHFCCTSRCYGDEFVLLTRFCRSEHSRAQSYFLLGMTNGVNSYREPRKIDYPETMKALHYPYNPFMRGSSYSNRELNLGQDHGNAQI